MISERHYRGFLLAFFSTSLMCCLLSYLAVLIVDPYGLYRLVDLPGFNREKPFPERFQKEIKLSGALALKANALILGNSRAQIGFDPDYRGWQAKGYSAYDLAISGTGLPTSRDELDYLYRTGHDPALVVLGVDFLDFLAPPQLPRTGKRASDASLWSGLQWRFDSAFSMKSVIDTIKTLRMQNRPEEESMTARGFNPLREYNKYAREQGYYALFEQRAEENAKAFVKKRQFTVPDPDSQTESWRAFDAILAAAAEHHTELHIAIYPYHAQLLAMFERLDWWPWFEQWKRYMAERVHSMQASHPAVKISLWDFSGYGSFQCQFIPLRGDKARGSPWYWEAGHFKPVLGEMMLAQMLDVTQPAGQFGNAPAIGYRLDSTTLAANRRRIAEERAACQAAYPQVFDNAAKLVAEQADD